MRRFVLDTNILVSGLRSKRGASHMLLRMIGAEVFRPVVSVPLVLEYEAVLLREAPVLELTKTDIQSFLDYLCAVAEHRKIWFLWRPLLPDPKDDMVLELAMESSCDAIVTFNRKHFISYLPSRIPILSPGELVSDLRRES